MKCPICGENIIEGERFCSSCGADMTAFGEVSSDKVIYNQTPEEQMEAGDDGVTQLIPENYMTAKGDDSVTQLIPENYMTAKGDDTATVMIDSMAQNNMGIVPPAFNPNANYVSDSGMGTIRKSPILATVYMGVTLLIMAVLLVVTILYAKDPVFYMVDSHVGGIVNADMIIQALFGADIDSVNSVFNIVCIVAIIFFALATFNALLVFLRSLKGGLKSPIFPSIFAVIFASIGVCVFTYARKFFEAVLEEEYATIYDKIDNFNIYDLQGVLCIVAAVALALNIVVVVVACKKRFR